MQGCIASLFIAHQRREWREGETATMERLRAACIFLLVSFLTACAQGGVHSGLSPSGVMPKTDLGPSSHVRPLDTLGGGPLLSALNILLCDAAPQLGGKTLSHLYLGVWRIDVTSNGQTGTLASFASPNVIDVLAYQGGSSTQVGSNNVATQQYNQLTFVVDLASSKAVFTDGSSSALGFLTNTATRSTANAGASTTTIADGPNAVDIISNQAFTVPAGQPQSVRVDFNAFESLAMQSGTLVTNPVLFLATASSVGQIQGTVVNKFGSPVRNATVVATDSNGVVGNTTLTDSNGQFSMSTVNAATYRLTVYNIYTNAAGQQYQASGQSNNGWSGVYGPSITVTGGSTASAGSIAD